MFHELEIAEKVLKIIGTIIGTAIGIGGVVAYTHGTFETQKAHAADVSVRTEFRNQQYQDLKKSIESLDGKITILLGRKK